jgi:hypothetical protein
MATVLRLSVAFYFYSSENETTQKVETNRKKFGQKNGRN